MSKGEQLLHARGGQDLQSGHAASLRYAVTGAGPCRPAEPTRSSSGRQETIRIAVVRFQSQTQENSHHTPSILTTEMRTAQKNTLRPVPCPQLLPSLHSATKPVTFYDNSLPICHKSLPQHFGHFYDANLSGNTEPAPEEQARHTGVYVVRESDAANYIERYSPVVLRHSVSSGKQFLRSGVERMNFGKSKGLGFGRVLVIPTKSLPGCAGIKGL